MNDFTASNGMAVREVTPVTDRGPWLLVDGEQVSPNNAQALREFFGAEADERLGRWRWPENPDYVVYPVGDDVVDVLRESSVSDSTRGPGRQASITRAVAATWDRDYSQNFHRSARAYFDAHPEPKPWLDAADGEVWALTGAGGLEQPWRRLNGHWVSFSGEIKYDAVRAIAGRRIWPAVSA